MITPQLHARLRQLDQLELAETILAQAQQLQAEVFVKIKTINQLLGLELDWKEDLEEVDLEAELRGQE